MKKEQPRSRSVLPHVLPFARHVTNIIEQSGMSRNQFALKSGIPTGTLYPALKAEVVPERETIAAIADGLTKICGVPTTKAELDALILDPVGGEEKPKIVKDILPPSALLWHLQRNSHEDRCRFWADALKLAANDFRPTAETSLPVGKRAEIDTLIAMINLKADEVGVTDSYTFIDWLLNGQPDESIRSAALRGLHQILMERRLPWQNTQEYIQLVPTLAEALGFTSQLELQRVCRLTAQDAPTTNGNPTEAPT